ncbi:MAG: FKBP-type peptidyl-prolyl cis-trans isomerase [Polyangiales bacterium]
MRISWIFVCLLGLSACKSSSGAPAEEQSVADSELAAPVEEATPAAEPPSAKEPPAAEADAPVPQAATTPVFPLDPNAPADVAAPPAHAKRSKSGLAWKVLKKGTGRAHPGKFDIVTVNYTGWTPDGRVFDSSSSQGQSITVPLNHAIPGFVEGLELMVTGEKRRLWIPGKLAYGELGETPQEAPRQPLGMLVFDVELVGLKKTPEPPAAPKDVGQIPADAIKSDSGLAWRVLTEGSGTDHPLDTSVVEMSYTLWKADGEVVDSSVLRSGTDTVGISRLVPGWTEGMKLMVEGERRLFWIPEALAYQGQPHRPAGMLVVDVTMIQIRRDLHQVR